MDRKSVGLDKKYAYICKYYLKLEYANIMQKHPPYEDCPSLRNKEGLSACPTSEGWEVISVLSPVCCSI